MALFRFSSYTQTLPDHSARINPVPMAYSAPVFNVLRLETSYATIPHKTAAMPIIQFPRYGFTSAEAHIKYIKYVKMVG